MKFKVGDAVRAKAGVQEYGAPYPYEGIVTKFDRFAPKLVRVNYYWVNIKDLEFNNIKVIKELMGVKNE